MKDSNPQCNICGNILPEPLYDSGTGASITSLCRIVDIQTRVRQCRFCSHVQTDSVFDSSAYYQKEYDILVESEEEDQIYLVVDGKPVFRSDYQVTTLLDKLDLKSNSRMLDYGCAKSATYRKLSMRRPDLDLNLFDVSERYIEFWSSFANRGKWAIGEIPDEWNGSFDVVTSFFAFEHISTPIDSLRSAVALLKPGGRFYCVVPNIFTNTADFVVVDHENHFTESSIAAMVRHAGFSTIEIDRSAHRGAFVVIGTKSDQQPVLSKTEHNNFCSRDDVEKIGEYWSEAAERIRAFESTLGRDDSIAVYGAGFYGTFITAALSKPERVRCYLDQNPFLQGRLLNEKWPVVHPAKVPVDVTALLVGLNPTQARTIIDSLPSLHHLRAFFL